MSLLSLNNLSLSLLGFFFLVAVFIFLVGWKQVREAHRLRDELQIQNGFSGHQNLAARMTHDIGNPLSVIRGGVNELMRKTGDEVIRQDLAQILLSVERISTIVQNTRGYIYQNEGLEEEVLELKEIIDDVLLFYSQRLRTHDIELFLKNLDDIFIKAERSQLEQLLLDLVSTSIDAVENLPEKWIEISALPKAGYIRISFRNSAKGLPQEIVRKHEGEVRYEEGPHTTFILDLPEPEHRV